MTLLEIYLCRHGETAWTLSGQHTSSTDISLTETGRQQAISLGKRLKGVPFTKVIASPMQRAVETCKLAGFIPILDQTAVEWKYGDYEGLDHEQIFQNNPTWNLFTDGAPGGESPGDVEKRAKHLIKICLKSPGKIAIFSHGHFLRAFAACWIGLGAQGGQSFSLSVASLGILGFEHDRPVIKLWNDTGHLHM